MCVAVYYNEMSRRAKMQVAETQKNKTEEKKIKLKQHCTRAACYQNLEL